MIAVLAQDGTQPRPGVAVEKPKIDPSQEIRATGCLAREADRFVLRETAVEITPWLAPNVRKDAPGAPKASRSKTVFALLNPQGLEAHVGQRIEVTGVVAPATANVPANPDTVAPATGLPGVPHPTIPGPKAVSRLAHPELDNKTVRMVAKLCP